MGQINRPFRWKDVVDRPDRYEVTVYRPARHRPVATPLDVTVRRLQKFPVGPGRTYLWEARSLNGGKPPQSGDVAVGADGLLTIPGVIVEQTPRRLVITPKPPSQE